MRVGANCARDIPCNVPRHRFVPGVRSPADIRHGLLAASRRCPCNRTRPSFHVDELQYANIVIVERASRTRGRGANRVTINDTQRRQQSLLQKVAQMCAVSIIGRHKQGFESALRSAL